VTVGTLSDEATPCTRLAPPTAITQPGTGTVPVRANGGFIGIESLQGKAMSKRLSKARPKKVPSAAQPKKACSGWADRRFDPDNLDGPKAEISEVERDLLARVWSEMSTWRQRETIRLGLRVTKEFAL